MQCSPGDLARPFSRVQRSWRFARTDPDPAEGPQQRGDKTGPRHGGAVLHRRADRSANEASLRLHRLN